ncbi:MAG: Eco57I restriction-modification methylase domain-containing protein [Bacteroidetes bacterium]|nr:Eco57I restriction-modification methylase domain-containing protein [Bacteroidota bacterium]
MKLAEHVEHIRGLIDKAYRNRLGRMGITESSLLSLESIPPEYHHDRNRMKDMREVFISETGTIENAYEKLVEELTFTLFNRMAALKVMEAHLLHPEIITRRSQHGDRSFAHFVWLEQHPEARQEEQEGLLQFLEDQLNQLATDIPLFSANYPYHLLPTPIELNTVINAFNAVENDTQVESDIWKSDDILGWLYESYNNKKKKEHKEQGGKTEYNKVSLQSQVYTPRWVVKFLVDNSLGKLYMEMYPESTIKEKYKIANVPAIQNRDRKPLTEIGMIDPTTGSGNFLLYSFDLFYDLYLDQIENYGADYDEEQIPELIIRHNLHGIDLDDRAVQLAQLGLFIKAKRKKRSVKIDHFNIVSSDFFLPEYEEVKHLFENGEKLSDELESIVKDLWEDIQQAHRFGSLIRLYEKFHARMKDLEDGTSRQGNLFAEERKATYGKFQSDFLGTLQKAVANNAKKQGLTFLNIKTSDAITFLKLLTRKFDVAVANPPYTDSADFGPELKKFIDANYKNPYRFNTNLYASFFKRCNELTNDINGFVALIHPHTFMFIKSFEDFRKFMINKTHIDILVDYGLDRVNLFGPGILLDATWYVISKKINETEGVYFNITDNQQEKHKQASLETAYDDFLNHRNNNRVYTLPQSKLKIIEGWPFIYWISDGFREKFKGRKYKDVSKSCIGLSTSNNEKYLRYWWEIGIYNITESWKIIAKGGKYNKWFGNLWLTCQWNCGKFAINNNPNALLRNHSYYFKEGYFFNRASTKGTSSKYLPEGCLIESSIVTVYSEHNLIYQLLSFSNSSLFCYIADSLNATVSFQAGDNEKVPYAQSNSIIANYISTLVKENIEIKKEINTQSIIETNFITNPLLFYKDSYLNNRLIAYLNYENCQLTKILINEAINDNFIFKTFELSIEDIDQVESKIGKPVGALPLLKEARDAFLKEVEIENEIVLEHINNLPLTTFDEETINTIISEFKTLYQTNNDLESFCDQHHNEKRKYPSLNPINVWYWFKNSKILPQGRAHEITLEFLADAIRTILMEDDDGIIPLVGLPGEPRLLDRLEEHCLNKGFTPAQFLQLDGLLGKPLNEYIEHHFFKNLSDHLNLFMYLPKTPFIWHLSSGPQQGFEAYIIIYKWDRDSLFKLKTKYLSKRAEKLEYHMIKITDNDTAQAQNEKEKIRLQLEEIAVFTEKIDELIAEGYDPKLDDGVGKNIAPLQKKGLLRNEVLNEKQLEKYLNADW